MNVAMTVAQLQQKVNSTDVVLFHAGTVGYIVLLSVDGHCDVCTVKLKGLCASVCVVLVISLSIEHVRLRLSDYD